MDTAFVDYYRRPEAFATFARSGELAAREGYFSFGSSAVCYGGCSSSCPAEDALGRLPNVLADVTVEGGTVWLPFDPSEVIANLRRERYASSNARKAGA